MKNILVLMKHTLQKQIRSTNYLFMIAISIFLGFLCVPGAGDNYQIFYLGGVRGIYNSHWLGAIASILPVILLWLPGFYLLRSQISEDRRLKIGQTIASAPISKLNYIGGKFLCNFAVLISSCLLFILAVMGMQFFRHESMSLSLSAYLVPALFITAPYLLVLAALTVLFDVIPRLKGTLGNIVIFIIWITLASISAAAPDNSFDLFGIGSVLNQMQNGARAFYPNLPEAASFGYYPADHSIPTFEWNGIVWEQSFLVSRLMWCGIAIALVLAAAVIFDRFRTPKNNPVKKEHTKNRITPVRVRSLVLSPVRKSRHANFAALLKGELSSMLSGHSPWWYLTTLTAVILSYFVVVGEGMKWISLIMLLPIGLWSQMGCREKICNTTQLIVSSCPRITKWLACWTSGVISSLLMSAGLLTRFAMDGLWQNMAAWITGALFITTLALLCGSLSGSRKLFEGLYIALMYFGPINNIGKFDFLGIQTSHTALYLTLFIAILLAGTMIQYLDDKKILTQLRKGIN